VLKVEKGTPVLLKDVARIDLDRTSAGHHRAHRRRRSRQRNRAATFRPERAGLIDNVKARLADMASALPKGVEIIPVYDRSTLIHNAIETLKRTLTEESIVVALVCMCSCCTYAVPWSHLHVPVGILMAFAAMKVLGSARTS